ncbi:MAG: lytic transglycosylase domain-containing protein [Sphingobacteriia bacterium]|nr:lytic transglycosylase domain-containing protein [Sphingobacteriia bacterium]
MFNARIVWGIGILGCIGIGMLFFASRQPETVEKHQEKDPRPLTLAADVPQVLAFAGEKIPLEDPDVKERLDRELQVNSHWHSNTILMIKRSYRWKEQITQWLIQEGLPPDLYYVALAESALLQANSPAGAKGFWQMMPETAKKLGLKINDQVDERLNIKKSTFAACKYLKEANQKLGSWSLAAAAYNMGVAGVQNALRQQRVNSYFDLYLNTETSRYFFRVIALKLILEDPEKYGFRIYHHDLYSPWKTKTFKIDTSISSLATWALSNGSNYKYLKILNPWLLNSSLTLAPNESYELLLPEFSSTPDTVLKEVLIPFPDKGLYQEPKTTEPGEPQPE